MWRRGKSAYNRGTASAFALNAAAALLLSALFGAWALTSEDPMFRVPMLGVAGGTLAVSALATYFTIKFWRLRS